MCQTLLAGSKNHDCPLLCPCVLFIVLSGLALISPESYIITIWKSFAQSKNLCDVELENKSGHVAGLLGLRPDLSPSLVSSLCEKP